MKTSIYPVIHLGPFDFDRIMAQVGIAIRQRASGLFLISHSGDDTEVVARAHKIKQRRSSLRVGINLLSTPNLQAIQQTAKAGLDMLWVDVPGVSSAGAIPAVLQLSIKAKKIPTIEVFGSVAFKYQPVDVMPEKGRRLRHDLRLQAYDQWHRNRLSSSA